MEHIFQQLDELKQAIADKGINLDMDAFVRLDTQRKELLHEIEILRARRNELAKEMMHKRSDALVNEGKKLKQQIAEREETLRSVLVSYDELKWKIPNIPAPDVPRGRDDSDNVELYTVGSPPSFDFQPKDHIQLGEALGLLDTDAGVNVAGSRGYYLKNELALMHMGVIWLAMRTMRENGFSLHVTPTLIRSFALYGTGYFPFGKDNVYEAVEAGSTGSETRTDPHYLAGTSEMSLLGIYENALLNERDLPLKLCGISPCYRSEVGSYGKDTQGLYRVHEFFKVEQVIITKNDHAISDASFLEMLNIAQELLKKLELPFRVVYACTGDMGAGKYKMYDIETWMPSRNSYGETHSNSHLTDWQARRLNIRYKNTAGETCFVHTLNNTVIASPRILIALLENNQQKDGSVKVPHALQEFVGTDILIPPRT